MRGRSTVELLAGGFLVVFEWNAGVSEPTCISCEPLRRLGYRPDRQGD